MNPISPKNHSAAGMSLIELIFFIVISGVMMVGLSNAFLSMRGSPEHPRDPGLPLQVTQAALLAQEKADELIYNDATSFTAGSENIILGGVTYVRTVTKTDVTSASESTCPSGANCARATIKVALQGEESDALSTVQLVLVPEP